MRRGVQVHRKNVDEAQHAAIVLGILHSARQAQAAASVLRIEFKTAEHRFSSHLWSEGKPHTSQPHALPWHVVIKTSSVDFPPNTKHHYSRATSTPITAHRLLNTRETHPTNCKQHKILQNTRPYCCLLTHPQLAGRKIVVPNPVS